MRLKNGEEIRGKLSNIEQSKNSNIKITFSLQQEVEIPKSAFSIKKLQSIIGKRIGILNLDGQYFLREI
jgi:hypothetical protein